MKKYTVKSSFFLILISGACSYCPRIIGPLEFKGVVKNKYIDSSYKNVPRIVIDESGKEIMFSPLGKDTLALYQHLHIGDSLIKKKGSYEFTVVRNAESNIYTMNCDPN
jgi:hypothetical protein